MTEPSGAVEAVELLPCPVCGEQPRWRGTQSDYARGIYRLQCLGETHLFQSYGPNEAQAAANWNTQATPSDQEKRISELEEALRWYGEQARLCRLIHSEGDAGRHALDLDGGKRAQKLLSPERSPK